MGLVELIKKAFAGAAADIGAMPKTELLEALKAPHVHLSRTMVEGWKATRESYSDRRFDHCAMEMTQDGAYVLAAYYKDYNSLELHVRPSARANVLQWNYLLASEYERNTDEMAELFEDRPQILQAASICLTTLSSVHPAVRKAIEFWNEHLQSRRKAPYLAAQRRQDADTSDSDFDASNTDLDETIPAVLTTLHRDTTLRTLPANNSLPENNGCSTTTVRVDVAECPTTPSDDAPSDPSPSPD